MPAHLRDLAKICSESNCGKPATVEVRNTHNSRIGDFCKIHGQRLVDLLNREATKP